MLLFRIIFYKVASSVRKLLSIIFIINAIYAQDIDSINQDSTMATIDTATSTISQTNSDENKKQLEQESSIFDTAPVIGDSYASFVVGYQMIFKKSNNVNEHKEGVFFALDRGWSFIDNILLFGFSLDGTAGNFYSVNINAKLGGRLIDGRLIPSISFGYGLLNHSVGDSQYNLHGASSTLSLFVDIISGLGIEVSYRVALHPFNATKKNANIRVNNINAFMVNFKFVDFSL